jgi:diaminopimelate epimerase
MLDGTLTVSALSTGSTHAVTFVETMPDDAEFLTVSDEVEVHPLFPERTSLMWVRRDSETHLTMRIWERGAGETLGCGTGACAAAVAARRKGLIGPSATVASAGGDLTVTWDAGKPILMTGPAEYVFAGTFPW